MSSVLAYGGTHRIRAYKGIINYNDFNSFGSNGTTTRARLGN